MYHINKEITGNGENLNLKNTAKHYYKKFDILGNSIQEGTPSIDSEAPIESVGDNINLLGIQDGSWTENGLTINVKDDEININGTVTASSNVFFTLRESLKLNGKYSFQAGNNIALTNGEYFRLYTGTTGFEVLVAFGALTSLNVKSENINISGTADRLAIRVNAGTVFNNVTFKPKIEKGSKATLYSPYGQGSIEIYNGNNNFLNLENLTTQTKNGVTLTRKSDGSYTLNGTSTAPTEIKIPINLLLKKGTYTHSTHNEYKGGLYISFNNLNYTMIGENFMASKTFTIEENTKYTTYYIWIASGVTFNNYVVYPMLEYGSSVREYIPHQSQTQALYTQQPFRAIGDVKDKFVKQNGVCNEKHNIGRYIFTGNEGWTYNETYKYFYCSNFVFEQIPSTTNKEQISNRFVVTSSWSGFRDTIDTNMMYCVQDAGYKICIRNLNYSNVDDFSNWLSELYNAGTPLYVDYLLAEPLLIPCTAEQVEVLEYFEKEAYSYDEVTHIYSTDEVSPYFEVTAYERISEEFKTRLKEGKITRGYLKVLATDTLPEIIINENNYLKDLKIEELRYIPDEGFIGGTVAKRVTGNFNNVDNSFDIQDREVEVYLGVELEDETTEYIKYGTYIVQRPEDDQVNDNTSFEALDYMVKFNQEYKDRITYPCTLKQLLDDIVDQAGVNSKVATFANSEFVVENNQFEQGTTLRDVLKAITQMAFNWSRIDADDNLVMDFEIKEDIDEELGTDDYFGFKKSDDYGPVNVIVLRNSQVEGENVTIKDEKLINSPSNKNICPNDWTYGQYAPEDGSINIYQNRIRLKNLLEVKPNTEYYLNTFNENYQIIIRTYMKDKTFSRNLAAPTTFITNADEYYIGVTIYSAADITSDLIELVNNNVIKPFICLNSEKDKSYFPFAITGEIELVIADNPFAYTELKRKQLIEAGRRLFGLKYTPMTVDMLGLMYLNSKDRITVENLNGQKYSTYLFDHTIDYTGIVLDSMESKAKTKTETKYQYVSSLAQGLSLVEIKVDKANKRIESIIESQEDVSEKVAKTVARIEVVYALSDSPTEAPTDGWSTTAPEWVEGKYMWQKTITTYANGSTAETAATNISGAQGKDGVSGNNSYSYVAFANSADGSKDFSRTDSTNKTYIGTLTINESVNENLLRNTNKGTTNWGFATQNGVVSKEQYTEEGKNAVKLICTTASTGWQYASYSIGTEILKRLKENSNYILSFDIKTNIGPSTLEVAIKRGDSTNAISQGVKADILGDETWEHFSVQLKTISDFSQIIIGRQIIHLNGINKVGYYIIENLKLEEGYRETSYSKSPEDLANDYTQYYWQYTKGEEGVGVKSIIDQYYSSTSNTEVTGGEWKETQDPWEEGYYIWTRTKITWTNDSITYTNPILANTLNDINSEVIVLKEFKTTQEIEVGKVLTRVEEVDKRLTNDYMTAEQTNSKINATNEQYEVLQKRVASTELSSSDFNVRIETIENNGVDKITTSMGYTFNDRGLNINRENADTGTVVDEAGIQVIDKTGSAETDILYAGYVKEGNTKYADYVGQTIVSTTNLIVRNYLVVGNNSRFEDYSNPTLGGSGTGAFDI